MKIILISILSVLFAVGCSKKESATAPIRVEIARGDIASHAEITTNHYQGHTSYCIQFQLSSAKEAELLKLAQQHPDGMVEFGVGSKFSKMRMPAKSLKSPIQLAVAFGSLKDASAAEQTLKELSQ